MPTYDYTCSSCGYFEYFQKITEQPLSVCPHCGGEVRRLISKNSNIIFKGSGFHITDYRKPDYQKRAKEESGKPESSKAGSSEASKAS